MMHERGRCASEEECQINNDNIIREYGKLKLCLSNKRRAAMRDGIAYLLYWRKGENTG